jgi:hypothetical protein
MIANNNKQKGQNVDRQCHQTGMVGEGRFITWASAQGWDLYRGLDGHTRCDYIVDDGERMFRVEVKRMESEQRSEQNYYYVTATKLETSRFDYLFASTPVGDYFIPASVCPKSTLTIKVVGGEYQRNITAPGKWEQYRVQP